MAILIRSPKCGSDWTQNELIAYNISIENSGERNFFKDSLKEVPEYVNNNFLNFEFSPGLSVPEDNKLLAYLDLASKTTEGQESAVDDFSSRLLEHMNFDIGQRLIRTRYFLRFTIAGVDSSAQTDVCIIERNKGLLLLLQEDKRIENPKDPEPQVIAEAIAAFQENNRMRQDNGKDPLKRMLFPCITMVGTYPTFYLIPVTKELSECVITGQYPINRTGVLRFLPIIPRRVSDGMKPTSNRIRIIRCLESFKKFVDKLEEDLDN